MRVFSGLRLHTSAIKMQKCRKRYVEKTEIKSCTNRKASPLEKGEQNLILAKKCSPHPSLRDTFPKGEG